MQEGRPPPPRLHRKRRFSINNRIRRGGRKSPPIGAEKILISTFSKLIYGATVRGGGPEESPPATLWGRPSARLID
ncbi:hypothetical protein GEV33_008514 [Tenebrio molitor]|uniref:Uncharacterized protein n=1 Tax=Tenebrio molitor TaxID=7067 RepID=A0A8J6HHE1_TENMO|nr:hypothetical protein GEV33_008514 [Tenebrio molitor]